MVEIYLNEERYPTPGEVELTVGDLARQLCQGDAGPVSLVIDVRCDGREFADNELDPILAQPLSAFNRIEFQTRPIGPLVSGTLTQTLELVETTDHLRIRSADLLEAGSTEGALRDLQVFFEQWRQIQESILVCAQTLGCSLDTLEINGQPLSTILESFKTILGELRQAVLEQDFVVLGDLLRYEFEEPLGIWRNLLKDLSSKAANLTP